MGYTLSYRSCNSVSPEQEAAIRQAADAINQGRTWTLAFEKDERDGHLLCAMKSAEVPDGTRAAGEARKWPGPYEAKCLLDALCTISHDCKVDWEIRDTYCLRPIGLIRDGVCHADKEAQEEAARNMAEVLLGSKLGPAPSTTD
ncbi:MAG: hypothetical protein L0Y72_06410 [Gemmataceae bacterium]|nr:hypothetical protein [Gemmataceae bacterium]MCI0738658.1 hypothetical protein [Gemmataceae bacterium]